MKTKYLILLLFFSSNILGVFSMVDDRHGSTGPGGGTPGFSISEKLYTFQIQKLNKLVHHLVFQI